MQVILECFSRYLPPLSISVIGLVYPVKRTISVCAEDDVDNNKLAHFEPLAR